MADSFRDVSMLYVFVSSAFLPRDEHFFKQRYSKGNTTISNAEYEKKLIEGFREAQDGKSKIVVFSAPAVGGWPFRSRRLFVKGFTSDDTFVPVSYCALYGLVNFFKKISIISRIKKFLKQIDSKTAIHLIVPEAHRPYLEALKFLKRKHEAVFSTLIVPDLPIHMAKSSNPIYLFLKRMDVKKINSLINSYVDSFVCFTPKIAETILCYKKPYFVKQGICPSQTRFQIMSRTEITDSEFPVRTVYVGKISEDNGIQLIVEAAQKTQGRIIYDVYGDGPMSDELATLHLDNFHYHGFVSPSAVPEILSSADVLLSPRLPKGEYISYSFPSKMFDYLCAGKPIVTFRLPCYFERLDSILFYPKTVTSESLIESIVFASRCGKIDFGAYADIIQEFSAKKLAMEIACFSDDYFHFVAKG